MELDELKSSWRRLDQRVHELTLINRSLSIDNAVGKARSRLAPLMIGAAAGALIGAAFAIVSAIYVGDHWDSPAALFAGSFLCLMSLAYASVHAVRLHLAQRIDFALPVIEIQRSLASLQRWEAWSFHAMWMACCLLPLGVLNGVAIALQGAALWSRAPAWLVANILVCLAFGAGPLVVYLVSRRRQGKLAARMETFLSSRTIVDARAAIAEIDEFAGNDR